jgi:ABC-2 type transport system ATP-binding protein
MPMVEALCDRVAMINQGRLVLYGGLDEIRRSHGVASVLVDTGDGALGALPAVGHIEPQGTLSRVFLRDGARPRDLMQQIQQRGLVVEHFEVVRAPLEEIFVQTVAAANSAATAASSAVPAAAAAARGGAA